MVPDGAYSLISGIMSNPILGEGTIRGETLTTSDDPSANMPGKGPTATGCVFSDL